MMEIINIIALIIIPVIAVVIGQKLQVCSQKRNDKMQIFKTLMTSRIFGWTNESVQAMNLIDVVFANDKAVRKQWKICFDEMCVENPTDTDLSKIKLEREKLLEAMAKSLGYKDIITWESIQNPYIPKGMTDLMAQQQAYQNNQSIIMEQMKKMSADKRKGTSIMNKLTMRTPNLRMRIIKSWRHFFRMRLRRRLTRPRAKWCGRLTRMF